VLIGLTTSEELKSCWENGFLVQQSKWLSQTIYFALLGEYREKRREKYSFILT